MFSPGTRVLFEQLPSLQGMSPERSRRVLSTAYLDLISTRAHLERTTGEGRPEAFDYIRRLANALESFSVFDREGTEEVRRGAAFVAGEALSLLVESFGDGDGSIDLANDVCYAAIEAALLFTIAGFDANAATVISHLKHSDGASGTAQITTWAAEMVIGLCAGDPNTRNITPLALPAAPISSRALSAIWLEVGRAIQDYFRWLCLESEEGLERARQVLRKIRMLLNGENASVHPEVFHLAQLIDECIAATSKRALRGVGPISDPWYRTYVSNRARGVFGTRARPFFWPSTQAYAVKCLPGPECHAVIRVPTGAGKSFVAELASANAMIEGWVLYLVPTNALAAQVRNDLKKAFAGTGEIDIRAFLGGDEYTTLAEERVTTVPRHTIAVMTPEKCALGLRLSSEAFQNCRLCVFDECHLIAEGSRGALAELVISHLLTVAPECRFLLMSAMISNPDELAKWLQDVSARRAESIDEDWRPTRSLRAIVGVDLLGARENSTVAYAALQEMPKRRKNQKFFAPHVFVASLQGAWNSSNSADYALLKMSTTTVLEVNRQGNVSGVSWVNETAATLTEHFATSGSTVLTFLPASKHYPFSVGGKITLGQAPSLNGEVNALLRIAEDELGLESKVKELLEKGVAVHTAALLEAEKSASEAAFSKRLVPVMLATGTLAQGLNLPASVVLIAGTTVGDRRNNSQADVDRAKAQVLNALGRAGRAGVSNHGLGLVIPDDPLYIATPVDPSRCKEEAPVIAAEENSTQVSSSLERFLRLAVQGVLNVSYATAEELVAMAYLSIDQSSGSSPDAILRKSYGMHRLYPAASENVSSAATEYLGRLRTRFVETEHAPDWLPVVTYRTGLDYVTVLQIWRAMERAGRVSPEDTIDAAISAVLAVLSMSPPGLTIKVLETRFKTEPLAILWSATATNENIWSPSAAWLAAWGKIATAIEQFASGETLANIGQALLDEPVIETARSDGAKPIPRMISFTRTDISNVAQVAGAMAAIFEANGQLNAEIQSAPMIAPLAIKYGCRTVESLAWYRFAIRFRRPAHVLGRSYGIPPGASDTEVRSFVSDRFQEFLNGSPLPGELNAEDMALLESVRIVVSSA